MGSVANMTNPPSTSLGDAISADSVRRAVSNGMAWPTWLGQGLRGGNPPPQPRRTSSRSHFPGGCCWIFGGNHSRVKPCCGMPPPAEEVHLRRSRGQAAGSPPPLSSGRPGRPCRREISWDTCSRTAPCRGGGATECKWTHGCTDR